ncbi:unnamed protein product [Peronospora effusa]|nr:unnamed protein product [Peronospora effusa]
MSNLVKKHVFNPMVCRKVVVKKGSVTMMVVAGGIERVLTLKEVYFAEGVKCNFISYGNLDEKGYSLEYNNAQRVLADKNSGQFSFDVEKINSKCFGGFLSRGEKYYEICWCYHVNIECGSEPTVPGV